MFVVDDEKIVGVQQHYSWKNTLADVDDVVFVVDHIPLVVIGAKNIVQTDVGPFGHILQATTSFELVTVAALSLFDVIYASRTSLFCFAPVSATTLVCDAGRAARDALPVIAFYVDDLFELAPTNEFLVINVNLVFV